MSTQDQSSSRSFHLFGDCSSSFRIFCSGLLILLSCRLLLFCVNVGVISVLFRCFGKGKRRSCYDAILSWQICDTVMCVVREKLIGLLPSIFSSDLF